MAKYKQKTVNTSKAQINELTTYQVVPELFSDIDTVFSNSFSITHTGREFILSFLQAKFPIVLSQGSMPKSKNIPAKCVAQVALTPEQMGEVLQVMNQNFEKFINTYVKPLVEKPTEESGDEESEPEPNTEKR